MALSGDITLGPLSLLLESVTTSVLKHQKVIYFLDLFININKIMIRIYLWLYQQFMNLWSTELKVKTLKLKCILLIRNFFTIGRNMTAYLNERSIQTARLPQCLLPKKIKFYNSVNNNNIILCNQQKSHDQRSVSPYLYWLNGSRKVPRYHCFRQDTYYL